MNFDLRIYSMLAAFMIACLVACEEEVPDRNKTPVDTIPPLIHLMRPNPDTILLQVSSMTLITNEDSTKTLLPGNLSVDYVDDAAEVLDDVAGELRCVDYPVITSGFVNNNMQGVYTLTYNTMDPAGNRAVPLTRSVCVVESKLAYLNGDYEALFTNTRMVKPSGLPTFSSSRYRVHVSSSAIKNNQFEVSHLRVGDHYVKPFSISVTDSLLEVYFYDRDINVSGTISSGTLSPAEKSFTIETETQLYSPMVKDKSRSVFKKANL
jgi:hypothetical protein